MLPHIRDSSDSHTSYMYVGIRVRLEGCVVGHGPLQKPVLSGQR
jgi:hypothetical protein